MGKKDVKNYVYPEQSFKKVKVSNHTENENKIPILLLFECWLYIGCVENYEIYHFSHSNNDSIT